MHIMKNISLFIVLTILAFASCSEKQLEPITPGRGKPDVPTQVEVTPTSGGAVIRYRIPETEDMLGVKAVYTLSDGKERETLASFYTDRVTIEGYNDQQEHTVRLYAVNRAMELSDPVEVAFVPLESALSKVSKTLTIQRDFGGAQYTWMNDDRANLTLEMLTDDSLGVIKPMKILTTSSKEGVYTLRGYDTAPRWFAALVRDNFGNASDTIYPLDAAGERVRLSPMFEQKLDKSQMRILFLNNDANFANFGARDEEMIDDNLESFGHSNNGSLPAAVSIDLGARVKLSRVVVHQRNNIYYGWGNPKLFEIYTCPDEPDKSGDWSQWIKRLDCEIIKPSGLATGTDTDEDIEAAENGHDFSFSLSQEPVRYVRLNFTKVWTSSTFCHVAEITFYGDPNLE